MRYSTRLVIGDLGSVAREQADDVFFVRLKNVYCLPKTARTVLIEQRRHRRAVECSATVTQVKPINVEVVYAIFAIRKGSDAIYICRSCCP